MSEDSKTEQPASRARIVLSDLVPDGRCMVPVERPDEVVLVIREGEMSPALVDELNRHFEHAEHVGLWTRTSPMGRPAGHPPV